MLVGGLVGRLQGRGRLVVGEYCFAADGFLFFGFERRELGDATKQRIDTGSHFGLVSPLVMQGLLEDVNGFKADIDDRRRRIDFAVAEPADHIFDTMSDGAETLEADLRSGALHGVNGAEEAVDLVGIVVALEGNQAIADDLEMLFGFRAEEFENFGADFIVGGQGIKVGTGESRLRDFLDLRSGMCTALRIV